MGTRMKRGNFKMIKKNDRVMYVNNGQSLEGIALSNSYYMVTQGERYIDLYIKENKKEISVLADLVHRL